MTLKENSSLIYGIRSPKVRMTLTLNLNQTSRCALFPPQKIFLTELLNIKIFCFIFPNCDTGVHNFQ